MIRTSHLALAGFALVACAPVYGDEFLLQMAAGARAYHAGRYEEAAREYDSAAQKAQRVKDRDEARFLEARTFERAERWADAKRTYEKLIADSPTGPRTGRATFDIAELEVAHGDVEKGYALLEAATKKYPAHGLARPSIRRILDHVIEKGGEQAGIAWLRAKQKELASTEQAQVIEYELAEAMERAGNAKEAHDQYVATATAHPYPFGGLTDDAWYRAAQIDENEGRFQEAIDHLHELLAHREPADTVGSYERPRYSPAQMEIALIYRDHLKDHASARRELHKLYTDHKTSILRDDALWYEARLARDDGDASAACSLVATIAKELPDSRYARCGHELCPTAEKGKADCADYIVRDLKGTTSSE